MEEKYETQISTLKESHKRENLKLEDQVIQLEDRNKELQMEILETQKFYEEMINDL